MRPHNGPGPGGQRTQVSKAEGPPSRRGRSAAGPADWELAAVRCVWTPCAVPLSDSVSPGWAPVRFCLDCVVCAVPGPLLSRASLDAWSSRGGMRVPGCAPTPLVQLGGHSRQLGTPKPASLGSGSRIQLPVCCCPVSWGQSLYPSASHSSLYRWDRRSLVLDRHDAFILCLWVARQCEDTCGLGAWTRL